MEAALFGYTNHHIHPIELQPSLKLDIEQSSINYWTSALSAPFKYRGYAAFSYSVEVKLVALKRGRSVEIWLKGVNTAHAQLPSFIHISPAEY
jgi:hypothetical protein